jgi:hypothetical protein
VNGRNLLIRQAADAFELTEVRVGLPGRHEPPLSHRGDQGGPLLNVVEGLKRERRGLAGPMAGCAVLKDDRRDVAIERDARRRAIRRLRGRRV